MCVRLVDDLSILGHYDEFRVCAKSSAGKSDHSVTGFKCSHIRTDHFDDPRKFGPKNLLSRAVDAKDQPPDQTHASGQGQAARPPVPRTDSGGTDADQDFVGFWLRDGQFDAFKDVWAAVLRL